MHDARPLLSADAAEIVDVVEQRVDERAACVAGRRVNHHTGRLVHHDEIAVLVEDRQRKRLGQRHRVDRRWYLDGDELAGFHRAVGLRRSPGDLDLAFLDEPLQLRARVLGEDGDEKMIEPGAVAVVRHGEGVVHAALRCCLSSGDVTRERYTSITIDSGARMREMNCDVENMNTVPRGSPR